MINMTRKEFMGGAAAFAAAGSFAAEAQESPMLAKTKKWFKEAQCGMMAHWGLYTLPGGEWNGKPGRRAYAEWLQWGERIPMKECLHLEAPRRLRHVPVEGIGVQCR